MDQLHAKCVERSSHLDASRRFHEYMRESDELETWIEEQMQTACAEDYGMDYEHLQVILSVF